VLKDQIKDLLHTIDFHPELASLQQASLPGEHVLVVLASGRTSFCVFPVWSGIMYKPTDMSYEKQISDAKKMIESLEKRVDSLERKVNSLEQIRAGHESIHGDLVKRIEKLEQRGK
jgi:exonuclease VII small subunit